MIDKFYGQYTPICDNCEDTLPGEMTYNDAAAAMRAAGWHSEKVNGEWQNHCPDCWDEISK